MSDETTSKPRSLSGIKSTGYPHLGNVLGMIQPAIALQDDHEAFYFVADFHALTTVRDAELMRESTHIITAYFLALGLDTEHSAFFRQSDVPEVTELAWMLSCVTPMSRLELAHSYKAAVDRGEEKNINHGVFGYPVLMAADILIYDSDVVPVGRDQIQHVEMARDMAQRFNSEFGGDYLKLPEHRVREDVAIVPGIDGQKMSKSYGNIIQPLETPKKLRKRLMKIETDSAGVDDPKPTEDSTILQLYKHFSTEEEYAELVEKFEASHIGFGYGHAKQELFEKMNAYFEPYRDRFNELMDDRDYLEDVLRQGRQRVAPTVQRVMNRVREATGLPTLPRR